MDLSKVYDCLPICLPIVYQFDKSKIKNQKFDKSKIKTTRFNYCKIGSVWFEQI